MIEVLDTYYRYIKQQLGIIDPTQKMGGIANARDWPQTPLEDRALYLLVQSSIPIGGTESQKQYEHMCQWVWIVLGDDIAATDQSANRGIYRDGMRIMANLLQASYPGYCSKKEFGANAQTGAVTVVNDFTSTVIGGAESVWWTNPRFIPRTDQLKSGLLYGVAAVSVGGFEDVLPSVA